MNIKTKEFSCKERVKEAMFLRLSDIRKLYNAENQETDELGSLNEYGLFLDYIEPKTWPNQIKGYWRWQLSWGGPSEEFRLYDGSTRIEFWFLDWFDGAYAIVPDKDTDMIKSIMMPEY